MSPNGKVAVRIEPDVEAQLTREIAQLELLLDEKNDEIKMLETIAQNKAEAWAQWWLTPAGVTEAHLKKRIKELIQQNIKLKQDLKAEKETTKKLREGMADYQKENVALRSDRRASPSKGKHPRGNSLARPTSAFGSATERPCLSLAAPARFSEWRTGGRVLHDECAGTQAQRDPCHTL